MANVNHILTCLAFTLISSSFASAAVVEHIFHVQNFTVKPLCKEQVIPTVNGSLPGPTINVREGDTLVVHVVNKTPHNVTIHWHGVFQLMSAWMDGANMITQCPIQPGGSFTYRFNITGQEGTLLWHAHVVNLRATVHGALIIRPRAGRPYPFPKPYKEAPIVLAQWWNTEIENLQKRPAPLSDSCLINGFAGDVYTCSRNSVGMYKLEVVQGKRYLLRIINAALNMHLFFEIANHNLTVVAVDAAYTTPYLTDVIVLTPGQTVDALLYADQPAGAYYMAANPYISAKNQPFSAAATRGLIVYRSAAQSSLSVPAMPSPPGINDTPIAYRFSSEITGLAGGPHWTPVPRHVDEKMLITMGLGLERCPPDVQCPGFYGQKFAGSMNNRSFVYPETLSLQEAYSHNVAGVYTEDFPDEPPIKFDYTNAKDTDLDFPMMFPERKTSVKVLKFNSTVEIVLQNTALITPENHPIHLHGFNFYVLGQGYGNYDPTRDGRKLNSFNPQIRNTIGVPPGGWVVLRFVANNPGVWMFHCHMDAHLPYGIITAFIVQNGPTQASSLAPRPSDLPQCSRKPEIHKYSVTDTDLFF